MDETNVATCHTRNKKFSPLRKTFCLFFLPPCLHTGLCQPLVHFLITIQNDLLDVMFRNITSSKCNNVAK